MATIKDIAQLAQVSSATVSRILNHDATISVTPETRQKVQKIAKELQYTKKTRTQIKPAPSFTIGIVQWYSLEQELEDPYYLSVRLGVERYCQQQEIPIVRYFKNDQHHPDIGQKDGLICIGKFSEEEIAYFKTCCQNILFVDLISETIQENSIVLDFDKAMQDVLDYLCSLNHQKIGYLGGEEFGSDHKKFSDARLKAFRQYALLHGLEVQPYIMLGQYTSESGYQMTKKMIDEGTLPSALFAASDPIAMGALRALQEAKIEVPKQVSLIGFDDISASAYTNPPLTTVHAPALEMGEYAAQLVASKLLCNTKIPMKIYLPCHLVKRETCQIKEDQK